MKELKIIKKYFSIFKVDRKYTIKYIAILVFSSVFGLFTPLVYGRIIGNITLNLYEKAFIFLGVYLLIYLVGSVFKYFEYVMYGVFFKMLYVSLQKRALNALYKMPIHMLKEGKNGKYINIMTNDIGKLASYFDYIVMEIIAVFSIFVMLVIIFTINIYVGILVILVNALNLYLINKYNDKLEIIKKQKRKIIDKRTTFITGIITGIRDVKVFNLSNKLDKKYMQLNHGFTSKFQYEMKARAVKQVLIPMIIFFVEAIIIGLSIYYIKIGTMKLEHLIVIISYYQTLHHHVTDIMFLSEDLRNMSINIDRIKSLFENISNKKLVYGNNKTDDITGSIEFKNVSFGYNSNKVLKDLNFIIPANKITAIVGDSGSGKSTVYNLLLRLYKPKKGKILMDGINVFDFNEETYSKNITAASQDIFMFNDTIKNNMGLIDKNFDNIVEACKRAHIHEYIMTLPKQYDTKLGENASVLSGGQKQRLSLARTLLKKSEIILFDEITSALDSNTKNRIINEIYSLKQNHTIIVISHKLEEIKRVDNILLIKDGELVSSGTHEQLLENSYYRKIFNI